MATNDYTVKIGHAEIGHILNLKDNLDHNETVRDYAERYQRLGWILEGVIPPEVSQGIDFRQPPAVWSRQLADLSMARVQVNLGIRTGSPSRLLVLEVNRGEGALVLDQMGQWRSDCLAVMGNTREQHYYVLPPEHPAPPSYFQAPQVLIYGEGGLLLAPPSVESSGAEPWRWVQPPWETAPGYPSPVVWQFLKDHLPEAPGQPAAPSWTEVYERVAPHPLILKALLLPASSPEDYYQGIIKETLAAGLKDPELLLGLLWHAPHGEFRHRAERWDYLQAMALMALGKEGGARSDLPALVPPQGLPDPRAAQLTEQLTLNSLIPATAPGRDEPDSSGKFSQSVSGQFFQLLAGLGEKVIMESCRYEAMLAGLGSKAADLHNMVAEWQRCFADVSAGKAEEAAGSGNMAPVELEWGAITSPDQRQQQFKDIKAAAGDFLEKNQDLAGNPDHIRMVLFCLKNYITIDPECANLTFREKLERAGALARDYITRRAEY